MTSYSKEAVIAEGMEIVAILELAKKLEITPVLFSGAKSDPLHFKQFFEEENKFSTFMLKEENIFVT